LHLTPREQERLLLSAAAALARRRLERGAQLGSTEAIALVCDEICEMAWDGLAIADLIERAQGLIDPASLLDGVAAMVPAIEVEALFPHGTALVHVDRPFGPEPGNAASHPTVIPAAGEIELAVGRSRRAVTLHNDGDRPVWVSSHFPLDQLNRSVRLTPPLPTGYRVDLPAGEAVLIAPDESRELTAVAFRPSGSDGSGE
jgi:urease subunit gamma/beta